MRWMNAYTEFTSRVSLGFALEVGPWICGAVSEVKSAPAASEQCAEYCRVSGGSIQAGFTSSGCLGGGERPRMSKSLLPGLSFRTIIRIGDRTSPGVHELTSPSGVMVGDARRSRCSSAVRRSC